MVQQSDLVHALQRVGIDITLGEVAIILAKGLDAYLINRQIKPISEEEMSGLYILIHELKDTQKRYLNIQKQAI